MPGQIMIFNSDLHHICPHLHSEANAQLSYLSSGLLRSNAVLKPMELDLIAHTNNTNEVVSTGLAECGFWNA